MKMLKKRHAVIGALVAVIALAGYFNWNYRNGDSGSVHDEESVALGETRLVSGSSIKEPEDFFEKSRLERDTGRSKATESLRSIAENEGCDEDIRRDAENRMIAMASRMEAESAAEAEIRAKGFSDCVVYINEDAVTVVVKSETELTGSDAARIQEILVREAGVDPSRISISQVH